MWEYLSLFVCIKWSSQQKSARAEEQKGTFRWTDSGDADRIHPDVFGFDVCWNAENVRKLQGMLSQRSSAFTTRRSLGPKCGSTLSAIAVSELSWCPVCLVLLVFFFLGGALEGVRFGNLGDVAPLARAVSQAAGRQSQTTWLLKRCEHASICDGPSPSNVRGINECSNKTGILFWIEWTSNVHQQLPIKRKMELIIFISVNERLEECGSNLFLALKYLKQQNLLTYFCGIFVTARE